MSTKMDVRKYIKIRGANENNLKNIGGDITTIVIFIYICTEMYCLL